MAQMQDTITATIFTPRTVTVPRTLHPDTAPAVVRDACLAYLALADADPVQEMALLNVADALVAGTAVCVLYAHDDVTTARVIYPHKVFVSKENALIVGGFCTFRREYRCFRLDAMQMCHVVTTPEMQASPACVAVA